MKDASLIIMVVLFGVITWTFGRNLDPRSHNAKTHWKDPCKRDNPQILLSPFNNGEDSSCDVTNLTEMWIPKLNIRFREIKQSLSKAFDTFRSAHGSGPSHMKIEELEDPTSNMTFDKLINRENNTETEKIIYKSYSSLTILAAYLTVVNSSDNYGTHLSDAIIGIKGALCSMKALAESLALDVKDIIPKIWTFSHDFQTKSNTELMNLNETVLIQGQEILTNLTTNFKDKVNSSLSKCEFNCRKKSKKRRLVCKTKGQRKGKGKGKKNKSKKQRKNRKGKGKNRSS